MSDKPIAAVMVMGGGVGGIQASLDLTEMGYKVYLVEKSPSIGGVMGMLDKTFPTNECSMCILSPKMVEVASNMNIEIITLADVLEVNGEPGDFKIKIRKRPRFVDIEKCTGCGICTEKCPSKIPDDYNAGLCMTRAIRVPFPQAVPGVAVIDPDACRKLTKGKCGNCVKVCQAEAINFDDKAEEVEINAGAVIAAPGYIPFDAAEKPEFGYGFVEDVITSYEFERVLAANGPTSGQIIRNSNGEHVHNIAFIQCVGSRDTTVDNSFCSSVCCMYATKQSLIAKEHSPDIEPTIFYIDLRAYGKDFERYYNNAKDNQGVRYVRSIVSSIRERQSDKRPLLRYLDESGEMREEAYDMVVLSIGLCADSNVSKSIGVKATRHGYVETLPIDAVATERKGIFVCGAASEPKDIPDTVTQASAAAGSVSSILSASRGTLLSEQEFPVEKDVTGLEPRVGVVICRCGSNIGGFVDVPEIVEYSKGLPNVVFCEEKLYACSQDTQEWIKDIIRDHDINRFVVASCTPRTHQPLFRETCKAAGLNKYLYEMANIREHCSWVHMKEPEKGTRKAKYLVKMAVAKALELEPLIEGETSVNSNALVIGAGVAGMTAALELAESGFQVYLVEKSKVTGGLSRNIRFTAEGADIPAYLTELESRIAENQNIQLFTGYEIKEINGFVGNFNTKIRDKEGREVFFEHGAVILATGGSEYEPTEYMYGKNESVITQWQLEDMMENDDDNLFDCKQIAMIQCVGSRNEKSPWCSKICCTEAVKNAIKLKERDPSADVIVLYRDIRTYGFKEDLYLKARELGVIFTRFDDGNDPSVTESEGQLKISVKDANLGGEAVELSPDLIVLSAGIQTNPDGEWLAPMLKVPRNADGFYLEAHMKLRPVDFATDGVFVCGIAHAPKTLAESISQAKAAAARAETILCKDKIITEGVIAVVDEQLCSGCGVCVRLCPYEAITYQDDRKKAYVNPSLCKGCGTCTAACSSGASGLRGFSREQIVKQIEMASTAWTS